MAKVISTILIDDIDGTPIDGTETINFAFNGTAYEIDLGPENAKEFLDRVSVFIEHARPVQTAAAPGRKAHRAAAAGTTTGDAGDIRAWAKANGKPVNERGRISATLRQEYHAATAA